MLTIFLLQDFYAVSVNYHSW